MEERFIDRRASDKRLERIEQKIDQLSEAMITLARAEEKLLNFEKNAQQSYERMNRFSQKLDDLEGRVESNSSSLSVLTKAIWILLSVSVAAVVTRIVEHAV